MKNNDIQLNYRKVMSGFKFIMHPTRAPYIKDMWRDTPLEHLLRCSPGSTSWTPTLGVKLNVFCLNLVQVLFVHYMVTVLILLISVRLTKIWSEVMGNIT